MRKLYLACVLSMASLLNLRAADDTGVITLYGLQDYTVTAVSANGKWAGGYFQSGGTGQLYGFRWNLETNQCELLTGDDNGASFVYGISNDGKAVGYYYDNSISENGAGVSVAGYYDDNGWHALRNVGNTGLAVGDEARCISADGRWIGGSSSLSSGAWAPVVWSGDTIYNTLSNLSGSLYTISNDGTKAAGWGYLQGAGDTRYTLMWDVKTGEMTQVSTGGNMWNQAKMFTQDGKHLLNFSDGWGNVYDVEAGKNSRITFCESTLNNLQVNCIDDNLNVYAMETNMNQSSYGSVCNITDGTAQTVDAYIAAKNVDYSSHPVARLMAVSGCSGDGNVLAIATVDTGLTERPLIVMLNQNVTTREPVALDASQPVGVLASKLTWSAPINNPANLTGYNVYRNGVKITATPVSATSYYDGNLTAGDYSYTVTAVYGNAESAQSAATSITIAQRQPSAPRSLYARQKGVNSAALTWYAPGTNLVEKGYFDPETEISGMGGGANSFEFAIKYDKEEMDLYGGYNISRVLFVPELAGASWELKIYSGSNLIYSQPITQTLNIGKENVVELTAPVAVSSLTDDVYCAIAVTLPFGAESNNVVGVDYNNCVPGYSDLIHLSTETAFYSLAEESRAGGYTFDVAYAMSMILSSPNDAADIDDIRQYNIYADGTKVGSTESLSYVDNDVADGSYTYAVEAEYADGRVSPRVSANVSIAEDLTAFAGISDVTCFGDASSVEISWPAPKDDDVQNIGYSAETPTQTVTGSEDNNWGYIARCIYTANRFKGLAGYTINKVRFYPADDFLYTVRLYKDGVQVAEFDVPEGSYTPGNWATVSIANPITIEDGSQYTLDIEGYDGPANSGPLAVDNAIAVDGYSNLASTDGGTTFAVTQNYDSGNNNHGNWLMGLVVADPNGRALPVDGYNVRIDGTTVNGSLLTDTKYTYDFAADADQTTQHRVNVDVTYTGRGSVPGSAVFFTIRALVDGIDNAVTADLRVYPNPATSYVVVEGADVEEISAYSLGGALVGKTADNRLDVSTYAPGLYILKVKADGKVQTVKLNVVR